MNNQIQEKSSLALNVENKDILRMIIILSKRITNSTTTRINSQEELHRSRRQCHEYKVWK